MMTSQSQVHISQLLNSLDHPQTNPSMLNNHFINTFAQIVVLKNQQQINRLNELLNIIHLNVQHKYLTSQQRRVIIERLLSQRYQNLQVFENILGVYLKEFINSSKIQTVQSSNVKTNIQQDPDKKCISEILAKDQIEKRKQDEATYKLIQQLQKQDFKENQLKVKKASKVEIDMECPICLQQIKHLHLALLTCGHAFHKLCTFKHYCQNINEKKFPLKCPQCRQEVDYRDIKEYLTPQYRQKYQRFRLNQYLEENETDLCWCPTPGCQYAFIFEVGMKSFRCPCCNKRYCLNCKTYHPGTTCKTRVDEHEFKKFAAGARYKQCPKCKRWIEKKSGCDHITCKCGSHFCYKCGGSYPICNCSNARLVAQARQQQQGGLFNAMFGNRPATNQPTENPQSNNTAQNNQATNQNTQAVTESSNRRVQNQNR